MKETELLGNFIHADKFLTPEEWVAFKEIWNIKSVKRKEIITATGKKEPHLYFITEGVQRIFYVSQSGKEATLVFTYGPSFGGVLDSFLIQQKSKYTYEALTPSTMLYTTHEMFLALTVKYPAIDNIMRQGVYHAFAGLLERMAELQSFTSEEKFRSLLKRSPHLLQILPHKYLANYLGIDPTNFSKMINSIKI